MYRCSVCRSSKGPPQREDKGIYDKIVNGPIIPGKLIWNDLVCFTAVVLHNTRFSNTQSDLNQGTSHVFFNGPPTD